MRPRLDLRLAQKLVMTPQLQQAIKLLQLTRLELTQTISQELLENPVLDESITESADDTAPDAGERTETADEVGAGTSVRESGEELASPFDLNWDASGDDSPMEWRESESPDSSLEDRPSYEQTLTKATTLHEHLLWQLSVSGLDEADKTIGTQIIGNIDDDGYLRTSVDELAVECGASPAQVERVLKIVHTFDPTGVGARTLKECLSLQLAALGVSDSVAQTLVTDHLEELEQPDHAALAARIGCSPEEVAQAARVIERLEPKPGRPFASADNQVIIPDVFIVKVEGETDYRIMMNDDGLPRLRVNEYYRRLLRRPGELSKSTRSYLEDRFRAALWLIRSIEQRNRTICRVTASIVKFQRDFLDRGLSALKPLVLRQVAEDLGLHESTISRVTTNKYAQTPQGLLELKYFFNGGIARTDEGEEAMSRVIVKEMIRSIILEEDPSRPLRDEEITERLRARRIDIARRTIAKYRAMLNIPSASKRKRVPS
ncbi:MAG TPA: RNA polymerase factor sigma-54, partial [Nitrospiria bacterium]|nr:RNA polymerase factor sigma-54 [Nitrospiria bacterium]